MENKDGHSTPVLQGVIMVVLYSSFLVDGLPRCARVEDTDCCLGLEMLFSVCTLLLIFCVSFDSEMLECKVN